MGMTFKAAPKSQVDKAFAKSLFAAKEQILTDCNYYARVDKGILRDSADAEANGSDLAITWSTPYAQKVYYTGTPVKDVNPHASLMWAHKAQQAHGKEWEKILEKGMEQNL